MALMALQLLGFLLGMLGFFGTVIAMVMPQWRCADYVGPNIITAMAYMKGLWMECVWNSAGVYQCETHRSSLGLPKDLQAARGLMVMSCLSSILAITLAATGMECTRCVHRAPAKRALAIAGASCFAIAGLLCLVTVSWTTSEVMQNLSNPLLPDALKFEVGQAVYVGFVSASLSLTGGAVFCLFCGDSKKNIPQSHNAFQAPNYHPPAEWNHALSHYSTSSSGYRLSDYV
ncbi:claudin-14-like [Paramormyrops kingsleyae]|nr:claudin-14-like [Paramormyrops kingsleyae]XP_023673282.1 claudin-14-like [Paramormyrops kingsleyae]XP_023673283.1 claudin-14-like [Paramormyrops kingsleyae]XP_023673285.1 claudin-14-like [Paramormyrops kingsleyae]XP_023673286.1 claudin-14-like [Paramormyrops kingsleyae]